MNGVWQDQADVDLRRWTKTNSGKSQVRAVRLPTAKDPLMSGILKKLAKRGEKAAKPGIARLSAKRKIPGAGGRR